MTSVVVIDFETRSELNISNKVKTIPVRSVYDYARHPSTEVLCLGWCLDEGPVNVWRARYENDSYSPLFGEAKSRGGDPVSDLFPLFEALSSGAHVVAHNVGFDINIWEGHCVPVLGWPETAPGQWYCTAALAAHFGLPRGLDSAAVALGIEGKSNSEAMHKLSLPTAGWRNGKPGVAKWAGTREDFTDLAAYCRQDVEVTRNLFAQLPRMSPFEREVWLRDQAINQRGIPVDGDLVEACCRFSDDLRRTIPAQLLEATGGKVRTPGQIEKIRDYCKTLGVDLPDLREKTVEEALQGTLPEAAREVLNLRVDGAGAALSKFFALRSMTSPDGRLRGAYKYYGGHTGRWSAEGVQPQNLAKPEKICDEAFIDTLISEAKLGDLSVSDLWGLTRRQTLTALQRPCFRAPPGKAFVAMDYSSIEARITAWLAGCAQMLQEFREGADLYINMAKDISANSPDRALGKATVLGCGFGMAEDTFIKNAKEKFGLTISMTTAMRCISAYRRRYPEICALWYRLDKAFKDAVRYPGKKDVGKVAIGYNSAREVLAVKLPSGRFMFYHHPRVEGSRVSYTNTKGESSSGWGGTWTENIVQAVAADVQRCSIWALAKYLPQAPVVMHSHDEIVTECCEAEAENIYEQQRVIMASPESWADGLPLDAKGWIGEWYRKD